MKMYISLLHQTKTVNNLKPCKMKTQNQNIRSNRLNAKLFNLIKIHSTFSGNIDSNMSTILMTASFEDSETGEFTDSEVIADPSMNLYNESELDEFFLKLDNEDFEIKEVKEEGFDSLIFGCPDSVYGIKIQNMYK